MGRCPFAVVRDWWIARFTWRAGARAIASRTPMRPSKSISHAKRPAANAEPHRASLATNTPPAVPLTQPTALPSFTGSSPINTRAFHALRNHQNRRQAVPCRSRPHVQDSLAAGEAGGKIEFNDVLLGNDGNNVKTGVPSLSGAKVTRRDRPARTRRQDHRLQAEAPEELRAQARTSPGLHRSPHQRHFPRLSEAILYGT